MKYKNLFFDLVDTIWAFSQNARDTFEEVYQKYSFDRYFDSFDHYYTLYQQRNTELWIEYGEGKITKDELNRQRFFYPLQAVGVDLADVLYEITSAGATVGLSRGLTPQLNVAGKWIVILTMYLGRIGPLTLGTAVVMRVRNRPGSTTHLGEEDIMIG